MDLNKNIEHTIKDCLLCNKNKFCSLKATYELAKDSNGKVYYNKYNNTYVYKYYATVYNLKTRKIENLSGEFTIRANDNVVKRIMWCIKLSNPDYLVCSGMFNRY